MGYLTELVKLNLLVYGNNEVDCFKNNSMYFLDKYQKSDDSVKAVKLTDIKSGGFYFLHYLDDSNWLKYSPVFVIDFKKFDNQIVLFCVNLNFIPLKVRVMLFDPYIKEGDFLKKNFFLKVNYDAMYKELKKYSFQYALMEYNVSQIKIVHKIEIDMLPRFLYSQHPQAKYDPKKLMEIWTKKFSEQDARDKEMMQSDIKEFYDTNKEISDKYDLLKGHIDRLQKSAKKYGGK